MFKKVLSNTIIYGLGQHAPKLISLILIPIITPFLTDEDYGVYGVLVAYIGSTTAFKQLGFSVILANSFYKNPLYYRLIWSRVFGFLLLWNIFFSLLYVGLISLIVPEAVNEDLNLIIFLYVIPTLFFDTIEFIGSKLLQYSQKAIPFGLITIIKSLIGYATLYFAIVKYDLGYLGWLLSAFTISGVGAVLMGYVLFLKEKLFPSFKFNRKWLKRKLKIALPVIPHFYSVFLLTNSDRIMMDLFEISIDEIGRYSLAYQIGGYFSLAGTALGLAYGPILMQMMKDNREKQILNITKVLSFGFIGVAFLVALWMQDIFKILVRNDGLQDSYPIAIIVVFSFTYYPYYYLVNTNLQYHEKTKELMKITFVGGIINVLLNLFMIPYLGIYGAAISTFIGYMFLGYFGIVSKNFNIVIRKRRIAILPLFTLLLLTLAFFTKELFIIRVLLTLLTLLFLTFLIKKTQNEFIN